MFCAPGRTRTYDRQIRRLLLYPLSYGGRATPSVTVRPARDHCSARISGASVVVRHEQASDPDVTTQEWFGTVSVTEHSASVGS